MAGNTATYDEVKVFLDEFKAKASVFGIVYNMDKEENLQTLLDLELFGSKRDSYILDLRPEDYYQGPDENDYDNKEGPVWMFGIAIKKKGKRGKVPIYIKIYITKTEGSPNYCISFHTAKFPMTFPYKSEI